MERQSTPHRGKQQPAIGADAAGCDDAWAVQPAVSSSDERHRKKHGRRSTTMRVHYFHFPSVNACPAVTRKRSEKMMPLKLYFMPYSLFATLHKSPDWSYFNDQMLNTKMCGRAPGLAPIFFTWLPWSSGQKQALGNDCQSFACDQNSGGLAGGRVTDRS